MGFACARSACLYRECFIVSCAGSTWGSRGIGMPTTQQLPQELLELSSFGKSNGLPFSTYP